MLFQNQIFVVERGFLDRNNLKIEIRKVRKKT